MHSCMKMIQLKPAAKQTWRSRSQRLRKMATKSSFIQTTRLPLAQPGLGGAPFLIEFMDTFVPAPTAALAPVAEPNMFWLFVTAFETSDVKKRLEIVATKKRVLLYSTIRLK